MPLPVPAVHTAGALPIANKPPDRGVERLVADVLGILYGCATR
jgi:hypothetical protein